MREKGPLLVYSHDGREGGLRPPAHTLWGEFYEAFPRDPHDVSEPPWREILCVGVCGGVCVFACFFALFWWEQIEQYNIYFRVNT